VPHNLCVNEVFKLVIFIKKSGHASDELEISYLRVSSEEAKLYSLTAERLGKRLTKAKVKLKGLTEGPITIRAYFTNGIGYIVPSERNVYFEPNKEEIRAEFFVTPTTWTSKVANKIRVDFEQKYKELLVINMPVKIYKRSFEALLGLNISGLQKYVLLIYSILGSIFGLYGTLANFLSFLPQIPF